MKITDAIIRFFRRKTDPVILLKRVVPLGVDFSTLVHVGAHLAQEREKYEACGFSDILWIEGSPEVHQRLVKIINVHQAAGAEKSHTVRHRTLCALLTDRDDGEVEMREFSNDGMSSSIFGPTAESLQRWPSLGGEDNDIENGKVQSNNTLLR